MSKSCYLSATRKTTVSLFPFSFGYLRCAPFGVCRASNVAMAGEANEKAFGTDENVDQLSDCED
jgi:hypothetical protein